MSRRKSASDEIRFSFTDPDAPGETGAVILSADRSTVRFELPASLFDSLSEAAATGNEAVQKWGITVLAGLTFLGGVLAYKKHRRAGYAAFAAAGLTGVGGWWLRRSLHGLRVWLSEPLPAERVAIRSESDGSLSLILNGGGLRKLNLSLRVGEFDPGEATTFRKALPGGGGEE